MDDQLGTAPQRLVGDGVHVPHDEVRPVARLDQSVRTAVDTEQHRSVLTDVGPQRLEVLAVLVAAHDDQNVPAVERCRDVRYAGPVEQEVAFPAQELHGVRSKSLELYGEAG